MTSWYYLGLGTYLEGSEDIDEAKGRATTFSTEGRAFAVVAAFSVYRASPKCKSGRKTVRFDDNRASLVVVAEYDSRATLVASIHGKWGEGETFSESLVSGIRLLLWRIEYVDEVGEEDGAL